MTLSPSSALPKIDRRDFHRTSCRALAALATSGTGWTRRSRVAAQGTSIAPPVPYVDMHVHLGQPWNERGPLTAEMLLRWMDAHHIGRAVVLPLISPESWFYPITPQWVLEQTKPYQDRLIPFCAVDPRSVNLGGYRGFLDILRRYVEAGARGMGEHKWGGPVDHPANIELIRACAELQLPVLFHMDNIRNTDAPGLPGLERLLTEVPEAVLIGHAPGWWASISGDTTQDDMGGYPRRSVTQGGAIDRLMEKFPNLYGEISAGSGANALQRDREFAQEFLRRRADRLLFGTDYLADGQEVPQFELLASFDLPREVWSQIAAGNAEKLLNHPR